MNKLQPAAQTTKTNSVSETPRSASSKASWHRPTVTFVPLQGTAFFSGSITDASTSGSVPTPP